MNEQNMQSSRNTDSIKFSIIIPVYKVDKYLKKCVDSVLCQTYTDFELILVDDGSPDNCPKICDDYAKADRRVKVIHKNNGGLSSARNVGLQCVTGKYVMFLDSDDYWDAFDALNRIAGYINKYSCDVLCLNFKKVSENYVDSKRYFKHTNDLDNTEAVLKNDRYISSAWSKVVCSFLFQDGLLRFVENVYSEDIDWSMRLAILAKHITYVDLDFYCYLQRTSSISHNMTIEKFKNLKNNINTCIALLECQPENMQLFLRPYVSYQYAVLVSNIGSISKRSNRRMMVTEIQKNKELLKYSSSSNVRMMWTACNMLGFSGMCILMHIYSILKRK